MIEIKESHILAMYGFSISLLIASFYNELVYLPFAFSLNNVSWTVQSWMLNFLFLSPNILFLSISVWILFSLFLLVTTSNERNEVEFSFKIIKVTYSSFKTILIELWKKVIEFRKREKT